MKFPITLLSAIAVFGLSISSTCGQGFSFYGQNARGFSEVPMSVTTLNDIGKNVYAIDNLADQMAFRLRWEMKSTKTTDGTKALYKQMKKHAGLTNELINAYRGKGTTTFRQAAYSVSISMSYLEALHKDATTSDTVKKLIVQSVPLVASVKDNASSFDPSKG